MQTRFENNCRERKKARPVTLLACLPTPDEQPSTFASLSLQKTLFLVPDTLPDSINRMKCYELLTCLGAFTCHLDITNGYHEWISRIRNASA
jgi:hypothetical protein